MCLLGHLNLSPVLSFDQGLKSALKSHDRENSELLSGSGDPNKKFKSSYSGGGGSSEKRVWSQEIVDMCHWGSEQKPERVRHGNHKVKVLEPPLGFLTSQPTITTKVQSFYFRVLFLGCKNGANFRVLQTFTGKRKDYLKIFSPLPRTASKHKPQLVTPAPFPFPFFTIPLPIAPDTSGTTRIS